MEWPIFWELAGSSKAMKQTKIRPYASKYKGDDMQIAACAQLRTSNREAAVKSQGLIQGRMGGDGQKGTVRGEIEKLYQMKLMDKRKRGVRDIA